MYFLTNLKDVRFECVPWKMSDFFLFPLFGFTLVIKQRNFDSENHWNTLLFFEKKIYEVRFEYIPWKNVWFCFISIVWVHFSHKTKFWFWKPLKYFICLIKKWCQIWICHDVKNDVKQCLIWFKLLCLRSILATSWELRILKFIEIV